MNRMLQSHRRTILWVAFAVVFVLLAIAHMRLRVQHQKLLATYRETSATRQRLGNVAGGALTRQRQLAEEFAKAWQTHPFARFHREYPAITATDAYFHLVDAMHRLEQEAISNGVIFTDGPRFGFSDFIHRGMAWDAGKIQDQLDCARTLLTALFRISNGNLQFISFQRAGESRELARFPGDLFDARKFTPLFQLPKNKTHLFRMQFSCSTDTFRQFINGMRTMPVVLQSIEAEPVAPDGVNGKQSKTKFTLYLDWVDCAGELTSNPR
ncbi:MAG: hypothetical protein LBD72_02325 [Puniceicoccales bacterium]|jgi:hypothetical protein|nr:hypothetical protein [Puniceicoccales bacterium]